MAPRIKYILKESDDKGIEEWMEVIKESSKRVENVLTSVIQEEDECEILYQNKRVKTNLNITTIEDFEEIEVIGRCSYGKIVRVKHIESGEEFALKIFKREMVVRGNLIEHTTVQRNILDDDLNHPFLVTIFYILQDITKVYFVMEYLSGGELFFRLKEQSRVCFSVQETRLYIAEILSAVQYCHRKNLMFQDLRPESLVIDRFGHVVVTGITSIVARSFFGDDMNRTFYGTPEYLSIEIITGEGHDSSTDYWTLGVILFEMLTGLPVFYSDNINEIYELICEAPIEFPKLMDNEEYKDAKDLITMFLNRDVNERKKCIRQTRKEGDKKDDPMNVRNHPFFKGIDWKKLEKREAFGMMMSPEQVKMMMKDEKERLDYIMNDVVVVTEHQHLLQEESDLEFTKIVVSDSFCIQMFKSLIC